ncbi:MAG: low specificity L-threonine aldolase [Gemmatimonadales bacterium]|nr:low specificity L-threonine aldolase [Gemmatimonadales bacterium]
MTGRRSFASDNSAGVHPDVLEAIIDANVGHVPAYGDDPYTARAVAQFRRVFGEDIEVFFVYGGTGANVLAIRAVTESYHSVICAESAHINVDECGAPEKFTGCKLLTVPTADGKLTSEDVHPFMRGLGVEHHAQPRVVSITQATELGTVYRPEEVRALADTVHAYGMVLHMDGARIANAAVSLGCTLKAITADVGVDLLSFGGTKNGLLGGEALVFLRPEFATNFRYLRKQAMQLASKMRFIAVQFETLLQDDLWRRNAEHANQMARKLRDVMADVPQVRMTHPVEANAVFAVVPGDHIAALQAEYFFYVWDEQTSEVRWMTAYDTSEEDIHAFAAAARRILGA